MSALNDEETDSKPEFLLYSAKTNISKFAYALFIVIVLILLSIILLLLHKKNIFLQQASNPQLSKENIQALIEKIKKFDQLTLIVEIVSFAICFLFLKLCTTFGANCT